MFYQKIDLAEAEKLMPEVLHAAGNRHSLVADAEPGVLRLLRELTQSNLFAPES